MALPRPDDYMQYVYNWEMYDSVIQKYYIFAFTVTIMAVLYGLFHVNVYSHWAGLNNRTKMPFPYLPFGNFYDYFAGNVDLPVMLARFYVRTKDRYVGFYLGFRPALLITDPSTAVNLLKTHFEHFTDRVDRVRKNELVSPMICNMYIKHRNTWRIMKDTIAPAYSHHNLKTMSTKIWEQSQKLVSYLNDYAVNRPERRDQTVVIMQEHVCNIFSSLLFGMEINALRKDEELSYYTKLWFRPTRRKMFLFIQRYCTPLFLQRIFSIILRLSQIRLSCEEHYFFDLFTKCMRARESLRNCQTKDFMQLLVAIRHHGTLRDKESFLVRLMSENQPKHFESNALAEHALVYFTRGYKQISNTITCLLFELAQHPQHQLKLQREIDENMGENGQIDYDKLCAMKFLEGCLNETLRKHPPEPVLVRVCTKEFKLPNTKNQKILPRTPIFVPILSFHHDHTFFPSPLLYNPNRISTKSVIAETFNPFGMGPRSCLGGNMAKMIIKCTIASVLSRYNVGLADKSITEINFGTSHYGRQYNRIYLAVTDRNVRRSFKNELQTDDAISDQAEETEELQETAATKPRAAPSIHHGYQKKHKKPSKHHKR